MPVESSYHGSALLYRLFQTYPAARLRIVEAGVAASRPDRRLQDIEYNMALQPGGRWLNTRFHRWISAWFSWCAAGRVREIANTVKDFHPEAILTVAHGYSWITAAAYAQHYQLPLHFIVHDDWPRAAGLPWPFGAWLDRQFGSLYRQAASRLCVSPFMVEEYNRLYSAPGTLLYPSRAADVLAFADTPARLTEPSRPLVYAFGGTINTGGHVKALCQLAEALESVNACLHLYGPIGPATAARAGLVRANVRICGLVPAVEFITRMRAEADVLFLPMSFASEDQANMRLCFPSKLTDYTAAGLPILIHGPGYSSAVRWARENPGVAEVVTSMEPAQIAAALQRLLNPRHRRVLAEQALSVGARMFSHRSVYQVFAAALTGRNATTS